MHQGLISELATRLPNGVSLPRITSNILQLGAQPIAKLVHLKQGIKEGEFIEPEVRTKCKLLLFNIRYYSFPLPDGQTQIHVTPKFRQSPKCTRPYFKVEFWKTF